MCVEPSDRTIAHSPRAPHCLTQSFAAERFLMNYRRNRFTTGLARLSPSNKRIVYEGGHFLSRREMVTETLRWFDQHLGPVAKP